MSEDIWNTTTVKAWQWVVSGVERGLTATAAVQEYRAADQHISNAAWYNLYREAFGMYGSRESIKEIPMTYTVPESMATESGYDWRDKYVMQMKVRGINPETKERVTRWVTAESAELLTKGEWRYYGGVAIEGTVGSPPVEIDEILDYNFYKRA